MLNRFRNALRRWLLPDPPPAPVAESNGLTPQVLASFQGMKVIHRPVKAPTLFPGVVPEAAALERMAVDGMRYTALDSADVAPVYTWFQNGNCGLGFPGYTYLAELSQRSEYRAPAEVTAQEMTREWITIKTEGESDPGDTEAETDEEGGGVAEDALPPPDEEDDDTGTDAEGNEGNEADERITDIINAFEEFEIRDSFKRMAELGELFGRSQLYFEIDHGGRDRLENDKLPLLITPETIPKGSLRGVRVIEPMWTTPYYFNANDPTAEDFYKPKAWFIMGRMVHATRLHTYVPHELPDMLKPAYNFGGVSLTQLMEPYVFQWLRTRNSVSDLVHNFSVMVLKTNMQALLQGTATPQGQISFAEQLLTRAKLFTQTRDNQGLTLLDKGTEELMQVAVPLSGLDALQAQAQEHMAAPTHIPLVKLLGITPTGLNASSEGEIKVFYDFIRAMQQGHFAKPLKMVLQIVQLHLFGEIDDAITAEFVPLTSPSVKELSDIRKADADSGRAYIEAGVIDPEEERDRLMNDPNSGYTNLSGPAPEPPPTPGLDPETGAPLKGGPFADQEDKPPPPKKGN